MDFKTEKMAKTQSKLSVAVFGPSGSGKTTSMFKIAQGIRDELYPGESLEDIGLFIDTERRSSNKAVGRIVGGESIEPMELYAFEPPYKVETLGQLFEYAINVLHKKIIVVDSYTAFWSGSAGILDRAAELDVELGAAKKAYGAWSEKEIIQKKNILKGLMSCEDAHIIMGFRAKTEYVMETNAKGKQQPRAVGLKEDMQGEVRYEFDVVFSLDAKTHNATLAKEDRLGFKEFSGFEDDEAPLTIETGKLLARLAAKGVTKEELAEAKRVQLTAFILDEKAHKSSKVTKFETMKGVTITQEWLGNCTLDQLQKLADFFK